MAAVVPVSAAAPIALEIAVAHEAHVATMAAIDHDDVACIQIFTPVHELHGFVPSKVAPRGPTTIRGIVINR